MISDKDLLYELSLKNQSVFEKLYKDHYKRLFILSFKYTQNLETAEEVVHDVFIKIWQQADSLTISHSLNSYLSKAVINTSLNAIKSQKKISENFIKFETELASAENQDEAEILEKKLLKIEKALNLLPPQCKKVLLMSKFEKLKQQEIATRLNISIKTVKNHLTYAYKKIREIVGENELLLTAVMYLSYRTF